MQKHTQSQTSTSSSSHTTAVTFDTLFWDKTFQRNVLSFFLADCGFGIHQFNQIVFPGKAGLKANWRIPSKMDSNCDTLFRIGQRNPLQLYGMLAPSLRRAWFNYNQAALRKDGEEYVLPITFEVFDTQIAAPLVWFDRTMSNNTLSLIFAAPLITPAQYYAAMHGQHVPEPYTDAVHCLKKWIQYGENTLCLIRNTPTFQLRFLSYIADAFPSNHCVYTENVKLLPVLESHKEKGKDQQDTLVVLRTLITHTNNVVTQDKLAVKLSSKS